MRTVTVGILLGIGTLLAFVANASVWANRTIFNTDEFVSTAMSVYSSEEVQNALATRITDRIVIGGDVEGHIAGALPEGTELLAVPLTDRAYDLIFRAALRIIQAEASATTFEAALRFVHTQIMAIIEDESLVGVDGQSIILDVEPIVVGVMEDLGVNDPEGFLTGLDLPPDAGQIVLVEDAGAASTLHQLASLHNVVTLSVVLATVIFYAAAIVLAVRRRRTARTVAILLIVVGVLGLVVLAPVNYIAASLTANEVVANEVFDQMVEGYRWQSLIIIAVAALALVILFLVGDSALATNARTAMRNPSEASGLRGSIAQSEQWLRAGGLVLAALALVFAPDPSPRTYITTFLFLAAYLVILRLIASDAGWATSTRAHIGRGWGKVTGTSRAEGSWVARHSAPLRAGGVIVAALILIFWPSPSWAGAAALVAATLIYLAVVDYLAGRGAEADAPESAPAAPPPPQPDEPVAPLSSGGS